MIEHLSVDGLTAPVHICVDRAKGGGNARYRRVAVVFLKCVIGNAGMSGSPGIVKERNFHWTIPSLPFLFSRPVAIRPSRRM